MPMIENDARRAALRRVRDDALLARLMTPPPPGNRAERREAARRERRRINKAHRRFIEILCKQAYRALRKARRAARLNLGA